MIPIPPNQCVKLRQNKTVFGTAARLVIAVAPVVVRPDILSKTAEIGSRICKNAYGRAQIIQVRIQEKTTVAKPSRSDIFSFSSNFPYWTKPNPTKKAVKEVNCSPVTESGCLQKNEMCLVRGKTWHFLPF